MKEGAVKYLCPFAVSKSFNSFMHQKLAFQTILYAKLSQAVVHCHFPYLSDHIYYTCLSPL